MAETGGDVAVIGAGLIGLAIAFELAGRGAVVRIYDRAEPAKAASWAGAGMLAPHTEDIDDEPMLELCASSLARYPAFVDRVRAAGGADPHLRLNGILHAAFGAPAARRARERCDALRERGVGCDVLDRTDALRCEPWLGPALSGGLLIAGEGCVDNRILGRALSTACKRRGVTFAQVQRLALECDARRVLGVRSELGFGAAAIAVDACGAWASELAGVPERALPPIFPVKGQMLALQTPAGLVRHPVWLPGVYVVPRDDGRLLVGATVEPGIDDDVVTAAGMASLLAPLVEAAPALRDFPIAETWAGLRPGTPDARPFIGATELDGFFLACGHFRNGILLAPATAELLAARIGGATVPELEPFRPGRVTPSAA